LLYALPGGPTFVRQYPSGARELAKTWGMISIPPPYPLTDQGSALDPRPPMGKSPRQIILYNNKHLALECAFFFQQIPYAL